MTAEEFEKEIDDINEWFLENSPRHPKLTGDKENDRKIIIDHITEAIDFRTGESHADYHLSNGDVIKTRNRSLERYCKICSNYVGDSSEVYGGWLYIENRSEDGICHNLRISIESVCWIDTYMTEINWKGNENKILEELDLL